jgi:hypothetical protein
MENLKLKFSSKKILIFFGIYSLMLISAISIETQWKAEAQATQLGEDKQSTGLNNMGRCQRIKMSRNRTSKRTQVTKKEVHNEEILMDIHCN